MKNSFLFVFMVAFSFSQFGLTKKTKVENVDGVAAVVHNSVILKSDVIQQSFLLAQQLGIDPSSQPALFEDLYIKSLNQMVDNLVLYELSLKDTNIVVDQLVVEESLGVELKKRVDFAGSAKKLEQMFGEPLSMIRAKLRKEIKKNIRVETFSSNFYSGVQPSFDDVKVFYNTYKDSLPMVPESVSFSVFGWPVSVNEEEEAKTKLFLDSLKTRVEKGESFYDLATKHSDDMGSSKNGGRLGFFVRGSLFPEYEEVAFSLSPGEVSDPFKTDVGYHIVLLEERVGEKTKTSHILKKIKKGFSDIEKSKENLTNFLGEYDVYNSVENFDSLCAHYSVNTTSFHGVYPKTPFVSLPEFLDKGLLRLGGYKDFFEYDNHLYLIRVWDYYPEQAYSLKNHFDDLMQMTKNQLINEEILRVINKEKENLYIEKFY